MMSMPPFRVRSRNRVMRWRFPATLGEFPLEVGMCVWGVFSGLNVVTGEARSNAIQELPDWVQTLVAILMVLAAITVGIGLFVRKLAATVTRGMYLFASILISYSAAVVGASGWHRGGSIAAFLTIIGCVCFLRGWWLKEQQATLAREVERRNGSNDVQ